MAKRLALEAPGNGGPEPSHPMTTHPCAICNGPIVVEDLHRDDRFPRRLRCAVCDAEYGTTRPVFRNY